MATKMSVERARTTEPEIPLLGLRFDRGRTELVLDAPLTLSHGLRLDALRTELVPLAGRLSLTEGWRALRHRRSTLVSATFSIAVRDLASMFGRAIGLETSVVALGASMLSLTASNESLAVATELEWGWDDEDLLLVFHGARSLPRGPRSALAIVIELATEAGGDFDVARGVVRVARPLRAALMSALVPAGLRVPATSGVAVRAIIDGERVVVQLDRTAGGVPQASRAALEQARADASLTLATMDGAGATPDASAVAVAADALSRELAADPIDADRALLAAEDYAQRERHVSMASSALLHAAERLASHKAIASRLAALAIERGGLSRGAAIARAIELSTAGMRPGTRTLPWESLSRSLEGGGPTVSRARGLALEGAGRIADALAAFAEVARLVPEDEVAQRGLARSLDTLERHDEAITAWDRVADLSEGDARVDAKLRAARAARAAGHVDGSIARLRAVVSGVHSSLVALEAQGELARTLASVGRTLDALDVDRSLAVLTDALGGIEAPQAAIALRDALDRALRADDVELARAHLRALERTLGDVGASEIAGRHAEIARAEERALGATDPIALRGKADAFRAAGRNVEAARVLIELFAQTKDAAVLRAAIELADRAQNEEARLAVFDRALTLLAPGAAHDAIAARR